MYIIKTLKSVDQHFCFSYIPVYLLVYSPLGSTSLVSLSTNLTNEVPSQQWYPPKNQTPTTKLNFS